MATGHHLLDHARQRAKHEVDQHEEHRNEAKRAGLDEEDLRHLTVLRNRHGDHAEHFGGADQRRQGHRHEGHDHAFGE